MEAAEGHDRVTVTAAPEPKPRKPRASSSKRGAVKPEHIEAWVTQLFAAAAMIRNLDHWRVARPDVEIRPWAPAAAELINDHLPDELARRAVAANAGVAVVMGIGTMVYVRLQMDDAIKQASRTAAKREQLRREEGVPAPPATPPPPNGRAHPSSGAGPVNPGPVDGLGVQYGGLR